MEDVMTCRWPLLPVVAAAIALLPASAWSQDPQPHPAATLPTVTVLAFETDRSGGRALPSSAGAAAADLMIDLLVNSGSYRVLDRSWLTSAEDAGPIAPRLDEVRRAAADANVDYIVLGSFTRYSEVGQSRGYGGGLFRVPVFGGVGSHRTKSVVGLTVRVVDVRTGEIAATATTTGTALVKSVGLGLLGVVTGGGFSRSTAAGASALATDALEHAVINAGKALTSAAVRLARPREPAAVVAINRPVCDR
jgi:curli biogenesis system outer membrane secretion channel CsgG